MLPSRISRRLIWVLNVLRLTNIYLICLARALWLHAELATKHRVAAWLSCSLLINLFGTVSDRDTWNLSDWLGWVLDSIEVIISMRRHLKVGDIFYCLRSPTCLRLSACVYRAYGNWSISSAIDRILKRILVLGWKVDCSHRLNTWGITFRIFLITARAQSCGWTKLGRNHHIVHCAHVPRLRCGYRNLLNNFRVMLFLLSSLSLLRDNVLSIPVCMIARLLVRMIIAISGSGDSFRADFVCHCWMLSIPSLAASAIFRTCLNHMLSFFENLAQCVNLERVWSANSKPPCLLLWLWLILVHEFL